eukprot:scaffold234004_cov38-Prasinocladus_malaysianus.AAC.2
MEGLYLHQLRYLAPVMHRGVFQQELSFVPVVAGNIQKKWQMQSLLVLAKVNLVWCRMPLTAQRMFLYAFSALICHFSLSGRAGREGAEAQGEAGGAPLHLHEGSSFSMLCACLCMCTYGQPHICMGLRVHGQPGMNMGILY